MADARYWLRREREARALADRATDPAIAGIHRAMAERYAAAAQTSDKAIRGDPM